MILRSVTKHVRDQNWFAVGLDFLIVVVGVFIGIQVANWNEARLIENAERTYLERLLADTEQMIRVAGFGSGNRDRHVEDIMRSLEALRTCTLDETSRESFDNALINHQGLGRIFIVRTTYDEMLASEALARIEDTALKDQIASTFATAERMRDYVDYFSSDLGRASDIIWRSVSFQFVLPENQTIEDFEIQEVESQTQVVRYAFNELCADPVFINAMVEVLDSNLDLSLMVQSWVEQLEALSSTLRQRVEPA
ncbi:MAG: hypothetical protein R3323_02125 [Wenzhouxiangellaceae bacterium]|nr:hypothetical protein [Wenzhouxiangellaceae bacterium]